MLVEPKKEVSLFDGKNDLRAISIAQSQRLGYTVIHSNYTTQVITPVRNILFVKDKKADIVFRAYQMIKSEIIFKTKRKEDQFVIPEINKRDLRYNKFAIPNKLKNTKRTIYNIDISSAYPTVLLNSGWLSQEIYDFLKFRLEKIDRLAALGMLASNKLAYYFSSENELINEPIRTTNPLANIFFMAVLETGKIIDKCREICGNSFLFYWVDGIYFDDINKREQIENYLSSLNYKFTFEVLNDFILLENKFTYTINFKKGSTNEPKIFYIDKENLEHAKLIIDALNLHDAKFSIIKQFSSP